MNIGQKQALVLAQLDTPKRFSEIQKASNVPESSVAKFLNQFEEAGLIVKKKGFYYLSQKNSNYLILEEIEEIDQVKRKYELLRKRKFGSKRTR
ncbi:MAG: hypothetical protein KGJ90_06365 [Patescibacteria group bacterium]|nr:hypothetical protein [Patescibacteria group bacterium]